MYGLGDNIYQRAVVRELGCVENPVYLRTPWPQLYADLPQVRCVRPSTRLRTQAKNAARADLTWSAEPNSHARPANYVRHSGTMLQGLCEAFGVRRDRLTFDLPAFDGQPLAPYVLVRPASVRQEWRADSRNPSPYALDQAVRRLAPHYRIVSVGDFQQRAEWPVEPLPYADVRYHGGELSTEQLLGLVRGAAAVVGGVGWLVPAAIAYRVPMLLLYGGWGFHNGPARIFDNRLDISKIHQVLPDRFCMCKSALHDCDKHISHLDRHLDEFLARLAVSQPADVAA